MRYMREVEEMLGAYPSKSFRVMDIVKYATRGRYLPGRERESARKAVQRALDSLIQRGLVTVDSPAATRGAFALYKMSHLVGHSTTQASAKAGQVVGQ